MNLRSRLPVLTMSALTIFTLILISVDCRYVSAQSTYGKQAASKAPNQTAAKVDTALVTFVEIGAAQCIPCKAMQPIMKEVAEEYKGKVKVVFHDVWTAKGKDDAAKYNIRLIPTQVFLDKTGKEYYRHEGYIPKDELVGVIKMQGVK